MEYISICNYIPSIYVDVITYTCLNLILVKLIRVGKSAYLSSYVYAWFFVGA